METTTTIRVSEFGLARLWIYMDRHLIQTVAEYLEFLQREWDQDVDDASLKRSSNVPRVLTDGSFAGHGEMWAFHGSRQ